MGTREIAKLVGCSRKTVKAALKREQFTGYMREEKVNPDIKPLEDFICDAIFNK